MAEEYIEVQYTGNIFDLSIVFLGALLCTLVGLFGIKFKWFKRTLDLQQLPLKNNSIRRSNFESSDDILSRGVFRKLEGDIFLENEKSKTLPPVRVHASNSKLKLPLPHDIKSLDGTSFNNSLPPETSQSLVQTLDLNSQNFGTELKCVNNENENGKSSLYQKVRAPAPRTYIRGCTHSSSIIEDDQGVQRRPTGIFHSNEINDLNPPDIKSDSSDHIQEPIADPDLVLSIKESKSRSEGTSEEMDLKRSSISEEDIIQTIKIPKPEPRTSVPTIQPKRRIGISQMNRNDTEV